MNPFPQDKHIVLFDGVCGLCNGFVDWILRKDANDAFRFAAIQSDQAKQFLKHQPNNVHQWTILLYSNGVTYDRSTAALLILSEIKGYSAVSKFCLWIPRILRDGVYRIIARYRYAWFGKKDSCRMPTPDEKSKFL